MKKVSTCLISLIIIMSTSCNVFNDKSETDIDVNQINFNFQKTVTFDEKLSSYNIFEGKSSDLKPSEGFNLLELSSSLFTDYAYKQRLVKLPSGKKMIKLDDGSIEFPNGTLLTKTFFYYNDERDKSKGKRIIETRLLIKENGKWNVATYIWNKDQVDAELDLKGVDTKVSWINNDGKNISTNYHVPTENECMACHQVKSIMTPIGPTLRNLNRTVERNGDSLNQLTHLQSSGVLDNFKISQIPKIVDYKDLNKSIAERSRSYLAMNCAHCHNPNGWEGSSERKYDFRYETELSKTGLSHEKKRIIGSLEDEEMPFIGTTLVDKEGVSLLVDYIDSLPELNDRNRRDGRR